MGDRCYEHGTDECLGCTRELEAEVERLRVEHDAAMKSVDEAEDKQLDLIEENERLRLNNDTLEEAWRKDKAEVERLRATLDRVQEVVNVIYGTRHASPPMDASECVVLLRQALEGDGE